MVRSALLSGTSSVFSECEVTTKMWSFWRFRTGFRRRRRPQLAALPMPTLGRGVIAQRGGRATRTGSWGTQHVPSHPSFSSGGARYGGFGGFSRPGRPLLLSKPGVHGVSSAMRAPQAGRDSCSASRAPGLMSVPFGHLPLSAGDRWVTAVYRPRRCEIRRILVLSSRCRAVELVRSAVGRPDLSHRRQHVLAPFPAAGRAERFDKVLWPLRLLVRW